MNRKLIIALVTSLLVVVPATASAQAMSVRFDSQVRVVQGTSLDKKTGLLPVTVTVAGGTKRTVSCVSSSSKATASSNSTSVKLLLKPSTKYTCKATVTAYASAGKKIQLDSTTKPLTGTTASSKSVTHTFVVNTLKPAGKTSIAKKSVSKASKSSKTSKASKTKTTKVSKVRSTTKSKSAPKSFKGYIKCDGLARVAR